MGYYRIDTSCLYRMWDEEGLPVTCHRVWDSTTPHFTGGSTFGRLELGVWDVGVMRRARLHMSRHEVGKSCTKTTLRSYLSAGGRNSLQVVSAGVVARGSKQMQTEVSQSCCQVISKCRKNGPNLTVRIQAMQAERSRFCCQITMQEKRAQSCCQDPNNADRAVPILMSGYK